MIRRTFTQVIACEEHHHSTANRLLRFCVDAGIYAENAHVVC